MAKLMESVVSSSARPLAMRKRPDLTARRHRYQGRAYWVVKDPVALNYFRFEEEEFAILNMLDGQTSLDEIKERFEAEFPPQKVNLHELQQFLSTLHRSGLIIAHVPGQGEQLLKRRRERQRAELLSKVSNVLAIRFKGIDPDRLLNRIYPFVAWMFRPWAVAAWAIVAVSALTLVLVQFDVFQSKLPDFHHFFSVRNAFWLAVALAATKVLHEFGHALSCKHFGGECHEIGVLILVLTPCLYCNVSDSWMLPNKYHRAMIGAAGMYVEILIASIATFVWWFSEPGLLNNLCLSTMFVASISTLIFNGNPLLRYDGYYILSDLLEIPNLAQKATEVIQRFLSQWCLGLESPPSPFLPERNRFFFGLYAVASTCYRWFVTFSILLFLNAVLKPYRLEVIGRMLALVVLYGLIVMPLWKLGKFFSVPGRLDRVKKVPLLVTAAVVAGIVAGVMYVPLPNRVFCAFELQPRNAESVYVEVPGILARLDVRSGQQVTAGQSLAVLQSPELELEYAQLEGTYREKQTELDNLRKQRYRDQESALLIPEYEDLVAMYEDELAQKEADRAKLVLSAPAAGTVLPPPLVTPQPESPGDLVAWSGTPLESHNVGATLTESTLFCQIGDTTQYKAMLVVDQHDVPYVRPGQQVDLLVEGLGARPYEGLEIKQVATSQLEATPQSLSNKSGGELATKTDPSGIERPLSTSFQVDVPLDDPEGVLRVGLRGRAKIHAGYLTLGEQLWRVVTQTFNFRL